METQQQDQKDKKPTFWEAPKKSSTETQEPEIRLSTVIISALLALIASILCIVAGIKLLAMESIASYEYGVPFWDPMCDAFGIFFIGIACYILFRLCTWPPFSKGLSSFTKK